MFCIKNEEGLWEYEMKRDGTGGGEKYNSWEVFTPLVTAVVN